MDMFKQTALSLVLGMGLCIAGSALATTDVVHLKYEDNGTGTRTLISRNLVEASSAPDLTDQKYETSMPQYITEHQPLGSAAIVDVWVKDESAADKLMSERAIAVSAGDELEEASDELFTIVQSGSSANRIDLVFMGDGYTRNERQKFIDDINRMVTDMFVGDTFASYLPVFNVYAVFRASNVSGIGRNDRARDTAYGLYRAGNTLRAIYPTNTSALRASCRAAPGCDYPVVIANDPEYGGLGGEFAISTSSVTSGTVVLRHELGHNFGRVGEEYDGGGYFGANNSSSVSSLKWKHWSTESTTTAEPSKARFLDWPWHNLSQGPYKASFSCSESMPYSTIQFSASGLANDDSLKLEFDGNPMPFSGPGTNDRSFHDFSSSGFGAGRHEIKFTQLENDSNNWISSIAIHEYGTGYHFDPDYIGAYPVFAQSGRVDGYRPSHETCLMRRMLSTSFCSVCQENNWLEFFGKVKMIDSVTASQTGAGISMTLVTQKLGQFRSDDTADLGHLDIRWTKNGQAIDSLNDLDTWNLPTRDAQGNWAVVVTYKTPEVRKDSRNLLTDRRTVQVN